MSAVKKFFLKDVRCFGGSPVFNIRPLTFLVGENSTGKSTVLGCMQALGNFLKGGFPLDFNTEPYKMGAFADIVRKVGGRAGGKISQFCLGFEIHIGQVKVDLLVRLVEKESGSEPSIEWVEAKFDEGTVALNVTDRAVQPSSVGSAIAGIKMNESDGKPVYTIEIPHMEFLVSAFQTVAAINMFGMMGDKKYVEKKFGKDAKSFSDFSNAVNRRLGRGKSSDMHEFTLPFLPPYSDMHFVSFAPIQSKPERTYNPEGRGMPVELINMRRKNPEEWKKIQQKLVDFGNASGLFTNIDVKSLGRSVNHPFQLQFKVRGPKANIIDVGYGVSQILPVLVRVFNAKLKTTFLVQQPEVHLHPKAQAELCSLFASIAKRRDHSFVVETHSDYMIKRARIEIMNGNISPEDVSLIYLEPAKNNVKVHNLTFDKNANFDPPKSYGEFFLRESNRALGFED